MFFVRNSHGFLLETPDRFSSRFSSEDSTACLALAKEALLEISGFTEVDDEAWSPWYLYLDLPDMCDRVDQLQLFPYNRGWEKSTQVRSGLKGPIIRIPYFSGGMTIPNIATTLTMAHM